MAKLLYWLGQWDAGAECWRPLGFRRSFSATADLVPVPRIAGTVTHLGVVRIASDRVADAEVAFAALPLPPGVVLRHGGSVH